jgi:hypothetical protein
LEIIYNEASLSYIEAILAFETFESSWEDNSKKKCPKMAYPKVSGLAPWSENCK